jgi:hypothetical protein
VNIGLVCCRSNQFLKRLKQWLPAESEHALTLDHAWTFLCLTVAAPILRGGPQLDTDRTEDKDEVVCKGANRLYYNPLDLHERGWVNLSIQVLGVYNLGNLLSALIEAFLGLATRRAEY